MEKTPPITKVNVQHAAKEKGVKTSTGLLYKVEKEGTGEAPKDSWGDTVVVELQRWPLITDGKEFG